MSDCEAKRIAATVAPAFTTQLVNAAAREVAFVH